MVHISRVYPSWGDDGDAVGSSPAHHHHWAWDDAPGKEGVQKKWASEKGEDGSLFFINEWMCEYKDRFSPSISLKVSIVRRCNSPDFSRPLRKGEDSIEDSFNRGQCVWWIARRHLRNFSSRIRYPTDAYRIWRIQISKHACQFWKLTETLFLRLRYRTNCYSNFVLLVASPTTRDNVIS